jgi:phosphoglycerate dehydrogenase-like enzyme
MEKIRVVVTHFEAQPEDLRRIGELDARVRVSAALYLNPAVKAMLDAARENGRGTTLSDGSTFAAEMKGAEVLFCTHLPEDILDIAPSLRWVHVYGAGMDAVPLAALLARGVRVSNSSGLNAPYIAEFVIGYMLMHIKHLVRRAEWQKARRWQRVQNETLEGKTLGIVGPGHIGMEIARRASAFGMTLLAARRSYRRGEALDFIDEVYPLDRLAEMLPRCDFVVVAVAGSPETRHLIDAARFAQMKRGAFFVNVARGAVVDQTALIAALASGQLAGAGLDVFDPEPLPPTSPLWEMPNVIVTAHSSGNFVRHAERANDLFLDNLRRYLDGNSLLNEASP